MRGDVDQTVAGLRAERDRLGLSLADVEARCGLKRSALSRLENDKTDNPTFLTLQRYAAALGLTLRSRGCNAAIDLGRVAADVEARLPVYQTTFLLLGSQA